jgi:putative phosphoesterase
MNHEDYKLFRSNNLKIGVLSDTHVDDISELPYDVVNSLRKTDLIIHLGDYHSKELVDELKQFSDFHGITGNHDGPSIRAVLPDQDIVEVNGKRLALVHGHGCLMPFGFRYGLLKRFKGEKIDALLYGHTHVTQNHFMSGVLFFNPGSAVGRFPSHNSSFGILNVTESISGEIFYVRTPGRVSVPRYTIPGTGELGLQKVPVRSIYTTG